MRKKLIQRDAEIFELVKDSNKKTQQMKEMAEEIRKEKEENILTRKERMIYKEKLEQYEEVNLTLTKEKEQILNEHREKEGFMQFSTTDEKL